MFAISRAEQMRVATRCSTQAAGGTESPSFISLAFHSLSTNLFAPFTSQRSSRSLLSRLFFSPRASIISWRRGRSDPTATATTQRERESLSPDPFTPPPLHPTLLSTLLRHRQCQRRTSSPHRLRPFRQHRRHPTTATAATTPHRHTASTISPLPPAAPSHRQDRVRHRMVVASPIRIGQGPSCSIWASTEATMSLQFQ